MDFTLVGLWNEMGLVARGVVLVLVAMSLYSLAITGDRLRTFWRGRKQSRLYIAALAPMVEGAGAPARGGRASTSASPAARSRASSAPA